MAMTIPKKTSKKWVDLTELDVLGSAAVIFPEVDYRGGRLNPQIINQILDMQEPYYPNSHLDRMFRGD